MAAYEVEIVANRGETVVDTFTLQDENDAPFDVSGWSSIVYTVFDRESLATEFSLSLGGGITLPDDGEIQLNMSRSQTDIEPDEYGHELRYIDEAGQEFVLFDGTLKITQGRNP